MGPDRVLVARQVASRPLAGGSGRAAGLDERTEPVEVAAQPAGEQPPQRAGDEPQQTRRPDAQLQPDPARAVRQRRDPSASTPDVVRQANLRPRVTSVTAPSLRVVRPAARSTSRVVVPGPTWPGGMGTIERTPARHCRSRA
jgi:hypothetical protein